jgi:glycosyltransferase involved in cell wall biosynthesis
MSSPSTPRGPVRVLHLTKGLGPGGAERLLVTFARLADPARVAMQVGYLLPWKDHLVRSLEDAGAPTHCLDGRRAWSLGWLWRLRRLVQEERIQVVHLHSPMVAALARLALRLPGGRRPVVVATEHNMWSSHHALTRWVNCATFRLQSATLAVSEQVLDSMPRWAQRRTEVVIHGSDVRGIAARRSERTAARAELGLADDEVVVVNVANLRGTKDHHTLLRSAALLRERVPTMRFLNVGQGPLAAELERNRDALGLADNFDFLGYQADPIRVLVAGDVFCLSSRFEGLPIASIEAMAAGLPMVVTAVGGMPRVLRHGVEGLLVRPGDPAALADALEEMADAGVRERCGEAASRRAEEFGAERSVERHLALYEDLADCSS